MYVYFKANSNDITVITKFVDEVSSLCLSLVDYCHFRLERLITHRQTCGAILLFEVSDNYSEVYLSNPCVSCFLDYVASFIKADSEFKKLYCVDSLSNEDILPIFTLLSVDEYEEYMEAYTYGFNLNYNIQVEQITDFDKLQLIRDSVIIYYSSIKGYKSSYLVKTI